VYDRGAVSSWSNLWHHLRYGVALVSPTAENRSQGEPGERTNKPTSKMRAGQSAAGCSHEPVRVQRAVCVCACVKCTGLRGRRTRTGHACGDAQTTQQCHALCDTRLTWGRAAPRIAVQTAPCQQTNKQTAHRGTSGADTRISYLPIRATGHTERKSHRCGCACGHPQLHAQREAVQGLRARR
jgi:hypothetical protein